MKEFQEPSPPSPPWMKINKNKQNVSIFSKNNRNYLETKRFWTIASVSSISSVVAFVSFASIASISSSATVTTIASICIDQKHTRQAFVIQIYTKFLVCGLTEDIYKKSLVKRNARELWWPFQIKRYRANWISSLIICKKTQKMNF